MQSMPAAPSHDLATLRDRLRHAVSLGEPHKVTARIKSELESLAARGDIRIPPRFTKPIPGTYARRLLFRSPDLGYTALVMTWGPGEGTLIHDHGGMWCVECVLQGEIDVTMYDLVERKDDKFRFTRMKHERAGIAQAGALIPPSEYHVIRNAYANQVAVTLHIYAGELQTCNVYPPVGDGSGWCSVDPRTLSYDE